MRSAPYFSFLKGKMFRTLVGAVGSLWKPKAESESDSDSDCDTTANDSGTLLKRIFKGNQFKTALVLTICRYCVMSLQGGAPGGVAL